MKLAMTVKFINGETAEVEAVFVDFIMFEKHKDKSVMKLEHAMELTDLAWLAWHAETRNKHTTLKFDPEWVSTVESVEVRESPKAEN